MHDNSPVLGAEAEFFGALVDGDMTTLEQLLAADFILVAVNGMVISKTDLMGAISAGMLVFEEIIPVSATVRWYGETAVVTGQTKMSTRFAGARAVIDSRYTHVYVEIGGRLQFVTAQGTQIPAE